MTDRPSFSAPFGRRRLDRAARIIAALVPAGYRLSPVEEGDHPARYELHVAKEAGPRLVADADLVEEMHRNDWLQRDRSGGLAATDAGLAWLRRRRAGDNSRLEDDPWRSQHLITEASEIENNAGQRTAATVVVNESPLGWLRRRRGADGTPLIDGIQFQAGERLRADFERGQLGPRVTADWTKPAIGRNRRGPSGGPADLLDSALAARQRVEAVHRALGPGLGALLFDVCCFLVGLEDAERRRGWPRRSAKVVLVIALDRLATHYGLTTVATGTVRSQRILHWGDEDYRPRVDAEPPLKRNGP